MIPERLFPDEMPLNPILYNKTEQQDSLFIFPIPSYKIIKAIIAIFAARKVIYYLSHADRQKTNRIHRPCKRSVYFTGSFRPHTPRLDTLFLGCIFRLVPHFIRYSGIQEFAIKKVNNLIIPLLFFYAFAYLYDAVSWGIYLLSESDTSTYERYSWWPFWEIIRSGMTYHNQPLWFLTALFEVNILYYFLQRFINSWKLDIAVWVIAIGGWLAAKSGIVLPYYLGTALISLPFFHAGTWLKREELLPYSSRDKYLYASILPLGVAVWLLAEPIRLHELILPTHFLGFYFCGIGGTLTIVFLCKILRHIPPIAYFGRFSIIVFGTHWPIYHTYRHIFEHFFPDGNLLYGLIFALTMITEIVVIELLRRFAPRFTAQKECISTARFHTL